MLPGQTIRDAIVALHAQRIDAARLNQDEEQPVIGLSANLRGDQQQRNRGSNRAFALFGPKLSLMSLSANSTMSTSRNQAELDISAYELYHKGYRRSGGDADGEGNDDFNDILKGAYDDDPRIFWNDGTHGLAMGTRLRELANYIFSVLAGSAGPEREFSRMGYLVSSRRSRYTSSNTNKRLTLANLIPQKRRLEKEIRFRQLKKAKLFHVK